MSIYLIRHTTPLVEKGICYGQADLDVTDDFEEEAALIKPVLPVMERVFSSPLRRCRRLAEHLFPGHTLQLEADLMEINCGEWELRHWDHLPPHEIDPWMKDFVNTPIPGGENYVQVFERTVNCFRKIAEHPVPIAIVTHGGVIRSILSHITETPLQESFGIFKLHYGCVVKIFEEEGKLRHEVLQNIFRTREQHKPSSF